MLLPLGKFMAAKSAKCKKCRGGIRGHNLRLGFCSTCQCGKSVTNGVCRKEQGKCTHSKSKKGAERSKKVTSNRYPTRNGSSKSGWLYIGYHPDFPGWAKIGHTNNLNNRVSTYRTNYPDNKFRFDSYFWTSSRKKAEHQAKTEAKKNYTNGNGEWYRISLKQSEKLIKKWAKKFKQ
tara:strand:- start:78 stop:608 length:531 start_codon:yes stop_codon:yes gene_type:complete